VEKESTIAAAYGPLDPRANQSFGALHVAQLAPQTISVRLKLLALRALRALVECGPRAGFLRAGPARPLYSSEASQAFRKSKQGTDLSLGRCPKAGPTRWQAYFPRDVFFFFGLGFPGVCEPAAAARFVCFFVAMDPPESRLFSK
jgi:hypothetical protein